MSLRVAGIDEAGRGPLAGPVVVAAVVFAPGRTPVNGLDDSKALTEKQRELLYPRILERALAWKIVFIEADEIDRRNIFQATMHGMREALRGVAHVADCARIDGNRLPQDLPCPAEAWVGGDARDRSIMAASILAKVARDARMRDLHAQYPQYGFDRHKGYPSPLHLDALRRFGPCPAHRRSFAPVRAALAAMPVQGALPGFAPPG
ncbi:ribonuclease HII [Thermomonas sp. S9]|uniref:ribonuclease HII n=1 Tax=Thermomonas sp. S9 TaxID=2885203 RepID=UPI00216B40F6|nr:ribonuclease HII [Thermomonas sp. S9]MCR6495740.1 ribonuclease HII [Thermomonas sp. S9]